MTPPSFIHLRETLRNAGALAQLIRRQPVRRVRKPAPPTFTVHGSRRD